MWLYFRLSCDRNSKGSDRGAGRLHGFHITCVNRRGILLKLLRKFGFASPPITGIFFLQGFHNLFYFFNRGINLFITIIKVR
jgi:hypothetical protein